jgi:hypothetical protein
VFFLNSTVMPEYNTQEWDPALTIPRDGGFIGEPASLVLDMTNLSSNHREISDQNYPPLKDLFPPEQMSSFCPRRGLQSRWKIISVRAS